MRRGIAVIGAALLLGGATVGSAGEVNCKFVMKNLSLPGRTVQSVAETMSISEADVKKCQDEAAKQGGDKMEGGAKAGDAAGGTAK
jgi:hypothetical protein